MYNNIQVNGVFIKKKNQLILIEKNISLLDMQINFYKADATLIQQVISKICHFDWLWKLYHHFRVWIYWIILV